jgi:hypothetical protein
VEALRQIIGREQPLDQFHLLLRRAAGQVPGISVYGSCLVTCSDELLGMTRTSFEREVATPLISDVVNSSDRVFALSNLGARLEPGALSLVDEHFTRASARGPKMLVIEIASHVGRLKHGIAHDYGSVERFGRKSSCCGALASLFDPPDSAGAVHHPWFEQLNASFGPVRLAALRKFDDSARLIAAAVIHAALQAESAVAEIFEHPPTTPTEVLLVAGVAVNQQWASGFLPVAYHHLRADVGSVEILAGYSLRTTPEALEIDVAHARMGVEGGQAMEKAPTVERQIEVPGEEPVAEETLAVFENLAPHHQEELDKRLDAVRKQVEAVRHDPEAWRSYARPILRGLFRGLSVVQPELGVAAMVYEGGEKLFASHKLKQIIDHGPATLAGRRVLHDVEAELQQLNHEDAQQVLDILLARKR